MFLLKQSALVGGVAFLLLWLLVPAPARPKEIKPRVLILEPEALELVAKK